MAYSSLNPTYPYSSGVKTVVGTDSSNLIFVLSIKWVFDLSTFNYLIFLAIYWPLFLATGVNSGASYNTSPIAYTLG